MTKECVRDLGDDPKEYDVEVNFLEEYREVRKGYKADRWVTERAKVRRERARPR